MKLYTIQLTPRGGGERVTWAGPAVCLLDAFMLARKAAGTAAYMARVKS